MDTFCAILAEFLRATELHKVACQYALSVKEAIVNGAEEHAKAVGVPYQTLNDEVWTYCWNQYIMKTTYHRECNARYALENFLRKEDTNVENLIREIL